MANVTLLNDKALDYVAEVALSFAPPHVIGLLECHLKGTHLNKVRRQLKSMGWKTFVTPAVVTQEAWGIALDPPEDVPRHEARSRFHNSGGEVVLCSPELAVWGHHQPCDAQGCRSIVYRAAGFSILVIYGYFLPGIGLDQEPNQQRCLDRATLIRETDLDWLILADWNREPGEVGNSILAKYLKGTVIAPNVPMTCRSTTDAGGRVLDFALASVTLSSMISCTTDMDVPFKPHFMAVKFTIEVGYLPDLGQEVLAPDPIPFCQGPWEAGHSWYGF